MIGKGSFAKVNLKILKIIASKFFLIKVYLAHHKETNEEFAIKAFNKEFLLSQNKGQVLTHFYLYFFKI